MPILQWIHIPTYFLTIGRASDSGTPTLGSGNGLGRGNIRVHEYRKPLVLDTGAFFVGVRREDHSIRGRDAGLFGGGTMPGAADRLCPDDGILS